MGSFEVDQLLFECDDCNVYKLPPLHGTTGYKAATWQDNLIWTGMCKVIAKGQIATVKLLEADGSVFAQCPVQTGANAPKSMETVSDSSRYFVLRIEDQGRHAFIGIGFQDREEAFDFKVALTDHKRQESKFSAPVYTGPKQDLGLKDGQKIVVNLSGKVKAADKKAKPRVGGLAPPPSVAPPGGMPQPRPQAPTSSTLAPQTVPTPTPQPVPQQAPTQPQAVPQQMNDLFGAPLGQQQQQQQQQQDLFAMPQKQQQLQQQQNLFAMPQKQQPPQQDLFAMPQKQQQPPPQQDLFAMQQQPQQQQDLFSMPKQQPQQQQQMNDLFGAPQQQPPRQQPPQQDLFGMPQQQQQPQQQDLFAAPSQQQQQQQQQQQPQQQNLFGSNHAGGNMIDFGPEPTKPSVDELFSS